jgi:hypothetical protein
MRERTAFTFMPVTIDKISLTEVWQEEIKLRVKLDGSPKNVTSLRRAR